jgi:GTPase-associated protein 1, N-terminal domain type 1
MSLRLHQTLHGYRDGHRLLQTSVDLPATAQTVMLELSDLSGPGSFPGFESYLTGYPVIDTGLYAFAKTWLAPEMSRPGCVWTHSLLLDAEGIRMGSFGDLLPLFKRPSGPDWSENDYRDPLLGTVSPASSKAMHAAAPDAVTQNCLASVLRCLYAIREEPTWIISASCTGYSAAIIRAWEQQWASLRSTFTFCTGAMAPRTLLDKPFDLQVVPQGADKPWLREFSKPSLSTPAEADLSREWLSLATNDLLETDGRLSRFIGAVGSELPAKRTLFQPVVELQRLLESLGAGSSTVLNVSDHLLQWFPERDVLAGFKADFYSGRRPEMQNVDRRQVVLGLIGELARPQVLAMVDPAKLDIGSIVTDLSSQLRASGTTMSHRFEALARSENPETIRRAMESWDETTVIAILDWANETDAVRRLGELGFDWNTQSRAIGQWLTSGRSVRSETLHWLTEQLSPSSHALTYAGTTQWLHLARVLGSGEDSWSQQTFWAFVFILALNTNDGGSAELAIRAFEPLHSVATRDRLLPGAWTSLEHGLPSLAFSRNSDRCEGLCQALLNGVLDHGWPIDAISEFLPSLESIRALAKTAGSDNWYRSLRPRLAFLLKAHDSDRSGKEMHG